MEKVTRNDLILFLIKQGYNRNAINILTFRELKRITILTIALDWGELEINKN